MKAKTIGSFFVWSSFALGLVNQNGKEWLLFLKPFLNRSRIITL